MIRRQFLSYLVSFLAIDKWNLDQPANVKRRSQRESIPDHIRFWQQDIEGSEFVWVVDYSSSMRKRKREALEQEMARAISEMANTSYFNVIAFHVGSVPWRTTLARATPQSKQGALAFLRSLRLQGQTLISPSVTKAIDCCRRNEEKYSAVILVSDGVPTLETTETSLSNIRKANTTEKIPIYAYFVRLPPETANQENVQAMGQRYMKSLAAENKGHFRVVTIGAK